MTSKAKPESLEKDLYKQKNEMDSQLTQNLQISRRRNLPSPDAAGTEVANTKLNQTF